MGNEDKRRNRRINEYSGKKFDPKIHEYQCELCELGFFVTDEFPRYIDYGKEVCSSCYSKNKDKEVTR